MAKIPPQLQNQLITFQELQNKVSTLNNQLLQLESELEETENAISELDKLDQTPLVYKRIGAILVKADKDKLKEELNDRKETLEMKIKTYKKQRERTITDLEEKRKIIQEALQQSQMGTGAGGFPGPM